MQHREGTTYARNQHGTVAGHSRWREMGSCAAAALAVALLTCTAAATARAAQAETASPTPIMKASEVRAGMRGYGLTTFKGGQVQRFEVEVLGVLRIWAPQGSVVLIRMSGSGLDETGTVSGMSGSPVYIEDKLLGAVAYGFPYAKIPLAGVTPAEEMLTVRDIDRLAPPTDSSAQKAAAWAHLRTESAKMADILRSGEPRDMKALSQALCRMTVPLCMQRPTVRYGFELMPPPVRELLGDGHVAAMEPLPIPLAFGGATPDIVGALAPELRMGGFVPVQAAVASRADDGEAVQLAPGAPVGVVLISGDMDVAGMGSFTMVDGERVLAFGHSMFSSGVSDLPLALGRVESVVPSTLHSFRLTSTDRVIGRITQDRESAIVGRLGEDAPMFPCTVTVKGVQDRTFNYRIAGYWQVAPSLAAYASMLSVQRWEGASDLFTVKGRARITLKGREEPIILENESSTSPILPAQTLVWLPLASLTFNPFQEVEIAGVEMDFVVEKGLRMAQIESLRVSHPEVEPGGTVSIQVRLKQFRGEEHLRKVEIKVPADARPGTQAQIVICDGFGELMMRYSQDPGFWDAKDLEDIIAAIERNEPSNTHLFVRASFVKRGVRYEGEAMPNLPTSVLSMLSGDPELGVAYPLTEDVKAELETPWVINRFQQVFVAVREPGRLGERS